MFLFALLSSFLAPVHAQMCAPGTPAYMDGLVTFSDGTTYVDYLPGKRSRSVGTISVNLLNDNAPFIYWVGPRNDVFDGQTSLAVIRGELYLAWLGVWRESSWIPLGFKPPFGDEVVFLSREQITLNGSSAARLVAYAESVRGIRRADVDGRCFAEVDEGLWALTFNSKRLR